jgi:hypothetical protein
MFSIFLAALFAFLIFIMGYYFGHQIGSTNHIRENLAEIRARNKE